MTSTPSAWATKSVIQDIHPAFIEEYEYSSPISLALAQSSPRMPEIFSPDKNSPTGRYSPPRIVRAVMISDCKLPSPKPTKTKSYKSRSTLNKTGDFLFNFRSPMEIQNSSQPQNKSHNRKQNSQILPVVPPNELSHRKSDDNCLLTNDYPEYKPGPGQKQIRNQIFEFAKEFKNKFSKASGADAIWRPGHHNSKENNSIDKPYIKYTNTYSKKRIKKYRGKPIVYPIGRDIDRLLQRDSPNPKTISKNNNIIVGIPPILTREQSERARKARVLSKRFIDTENTVEESKITAESFLEKTREKRDITQQNVLQHYDPRDGELVPIGGRKISQVMKLASGKSFYTPEKTAVSIKHLSEKLLCVPYFSKQSDIKQIRNPYINRFAQISKNASSFRNGETNSLRGKNSLMISSGTGTGSSMGPGTPSPKRIRPNSSQRQFLSSVIAKNSNSTLFDSFVSQKAIREVENDNKKMAISQENNKYEMRLGGSVKLYYRKKKKDAARNHSSLVEDILKNTNNKTYSGALGSVMPEDLQEEWPVAHNV